jgi:hypothetical protein
VSAETTPEDERDEAWLLARMRGEPAAHPDPERAAAYERLEQSLKALPVPSAREGWQAKVLAAIDAAAAPPPSAHAEPTSAHAEPTSAHAAPASTRAAPASTHAEPPSARVVPLSGRAEPPRVQAIGRLRPVVPLVGAVLAAAALLLFLRPPRDPGVASIDYHFEQAQTRAARQGDQASVGDTIVLEAKPGGEGELRLYRDRRELVLRCPGGQGCEPAGDQGGPLRAKAPLKAPGRYRAMVLSGAKLPAPSGNEDQDLGAAATAGAKVESVSFTVR